MPRRCIAFLLLFAAGCGGSDGPTEPTVTVASVTVSPTSATLSQPGETVQLSAVVRGSDGSIMSTTPSWSSSAAGVATVSSTGLVTGVAAGVATITAAAGGKSGSAAVTVSEQSEACENATTVSLAAGGSALFDVTACLILPSGQSGDRYRVAVYRPTTVESASDVSTVNVQVTGLGVAASPPAASQGRVSGLPSPAQGRSTSAFERAVRVAATTEQAHLAMRAQDARLWASVGAGARLPSRPAGPVQRAASPDKLQLDTRTPAVCTLGPKQTVTALLVAENDDLAIYQDSTENATSPVTESAAGLMLTYYSSYAAQMIVDYFGPPSDIDGNGKIIVFATPSVPAGTAAQVWFGDFYAQSACAPSNEMEIIYFSTPLIQDLTSDDPGFQALGTVVHEAKHLVSLYHRVAVSDGAGTAQFQPAWIEEGTAEIAGEMFSRIAWAASGGPPVGAKVTRDHLAESQTTPENWGILLRLYRTLWYLGSQPNSMVVKPNGSHAVHSVYGSGWNFHRWLGDAYGDAATPFADAVLFKAQNDSLTAGGTAGLLSVTGKSYEALLEEYFAAVMLHGVGPDPQRAITSYDYRTATATELIGSKPAGLYPWPVTEQSSQEGTSIPVGFNTATYSGPIGPSGVRIHDFLSNGSGTGAQIEVSAKATAKILVVRIR